MLHGTWHMHLQFHALQDHSCGQPLAFVWIRSYVMWVYVCVCVCVCEYARACVRGHQHLRLRVLGM